MDAVAALNPLADALLVRLLNASIVGGLAIAAVWLFCRLVPALPARWRAGLWWLASLKLILGLAGLEPVALPVAWLPGPAADGRPRIVATPANPPLVATAPAAVPLEAPAAPTPATILLTASQTPSPDPWPATLRSVAAPLAVAAWLVFALAGLARVVSAHRRVGALARRAIPVDGAIARLAGGLARRLGVRPVPVRESPDVAGPQVCGALRPVVLLPAGAGDRLAPSELELALCHELLHVRNADLWWALVPELAARLLPFHPLARLARREHLLAREAACDADVLATLRPAPERYGRLLVALCTGRRGFTAAAALGVASHHLLARRLVMLQHALSPRSRRLAWLGALAAAGLVIAAPVRLVGYSGPPEPEPAPAKSTVTPTRAGAAAPAAPVATTPAAPGTPAAPAAPATRVRTATPAAAAPPAPPAPQSAHLPQLAPMAPIPPMPAMAGMAPFAPIPPMSPMSAMAAMAPLPPLPPMPPVPELDGLEFVLVDGDTNILSGNSGVRRRAERESAGAERYLWFERDGESWLITDPAVITAARAAFEVQSETGARQGELGAGQGQLGAQQARLGAQQAQFGAQQAAVAAQRATLAAQAAQVAADAAQQVAAGDEAAAENRIRAAEAEMRKLEEQTAALEAEMASIGSQMKGAGAQMEALGRQQEALGRQQEALGRQQERAAAEAGRTVRLLLDEAVKSGKAKKVP